MKVRHSLALLVLLAWSSTACGTPTLSLPEYVDRLNSVVAEGNERIGPLYAELAAAGDDPPPATIRDILEEEAAIREELQDSFADITAPEQIADLHAALVDWHSGLIEAQRALAIRVADANSWSDFQQSPEFATYDAFMREGLAGCLEMQATLDATEARGAFADAPWIPGELKEVVDAALGCESPPDD